MFDKLQLNWEIWDWAIVTSFLKVSVRNYTLNRSLGILVNVFSPLLCCQSTCFWALLITCNFAFLSFNFESILKKAMQKFSSAKTTGYRLHKSLSNVSSCSLSFLAASDPQFSLSVPSSCFTLGVADLGVFLATSSWLAPDGGPVPTLN